VLEDPKEIIVRPANFPEGVPGRGVWTGEIGTTKVAVINLMGRVFMKDLDDPFRAADQLIAQFPNHLIIIDFHADATSEKRAFGFYVDGRAAAVVGTHTHVPTADAQLLPKGTAYITDVGYVGPQQSILGVEPEVIIHSFLTQMPFGHEVAGGPVEFGAVVIKTNGTKPTDIQHIRRIIELD